MIISTAGLGDMGPEQIKWFNIYTLGDLRGRVCRLYSEGKRIFLMSMVSWEQLSGPEFHPSFLYLKKACLQLNECCRKLESMEPLVFKAISQSTKFLKNWNPVMKLSGTLYFLFHYWQTFEHTEIIILTVTITHLAKCFKHMAMPK